MSYAKGGYASPDKSNVVQISEPKASNGDSFIPPQQPQAAVTEPAQPPAAAEAAVPGMDIMDGLMSLVLSPGRALVSVINPTPTAKDLPLILILSAGAWYGAYWLFDKYVLKDTPKAKRKRLKAQIETEEIPDEEEDGDDE